MRDFIRQFFLYSRSERQAILTLIALIVLALAITRAHRYYARISNFSYTHAALSNFAQNQRQINIDDVDTVVKQNETSEKDLFYFDPNTITGSDWLKLGVSAKQAAVIEKYRSTGARFYKPDDLRRIYVLSDEMKDKLVPYIKIPPPQRQSNKFYHSNKKAGTAIEINTADSAAFETLYGIGPAFAGRIIKFRNALGGFYSTAQIAEVYGLPDSTFRHIRPSLSVDTLLIARIDINTTDYKTLSKHPYIHAKIAKAIINYRNMNGKFEGIEQLKNLKPVTDSIYVKIAAYLKV